MQFAKRRFPCLLYCNDGIVVQVHDSITMDKLRHFLASSVQRALVNPRLATSYRPRRVYSASVAASQLHNFKVAFWRRCWE